MAQNKDIAVQIATKGRPQSLERCVRSIDIDADIFILASSVSDVPLTVASDKRVAIFFDNKISIVKAQNMLAHTSSGHILPTSDDVEYMPNAIETAVKKLHDMFNFHGVIGFNQTNIEGGSKTAFTLVGRPYYLHYGLYHPEYMHFYADTEFGDDAIGRGLFHWEESAKLIHHHPSVTKIYDETHKHLRNEKLSHDSELYQGRKHELASSRILHGQVRATRSKTY